MNLWNRFAILYGRDAPRLVATCIESRYGEFDAQFPSGAIITVVGAGTEGSRYFCLKTDYGWRMDGEAPELPLLQIDV